MTKLIKRVTMEEVLHNLPEWGDYVTPRHSDPIFSYVHCETLNIIL